MLKTITSFVDSLGSLTYKGLWNAATNTPTLASGVGTTGDYYVVSVPGTTTLDGISSWAAGDWAIFNGSVWEKYNNPADTLGEVLANGNTTAGTDISVTTGDDITFADSSKAIFGAGSDLQIYHDGSNSYISEQGTGDLRVYAQDFQIRNADGSNTMLYANAPTGGIQLFHTGAEKLATSSTGIDVTGSVTADGLVVDGATTFNVGNTTGDGVVISGTDSGGSTAPDLVLYRDSSSPADGDNVGMLQFRGNTSTSASANYAAIFASIDDVTDGTMDGSLSFSVTSSGNQAPSSGTVIMTLDSTGIDVTGSVTADGLTVEATTPSVILSETDRTDENTQLLNASGDFRIRTRSDDGGTNTDRLRIDHGTGDISFYSSDGLSQALFWDASAEKLGIGTSSPAQMLHLSGTVPDIQYTDTTGNEYRLGNNNGAFRLYDVTAAAERGRWDASGNLLVGTTSVGIGDAGIELRADGQITGTRDGDYAALLNRLTSDGDIIDFRKDGTTVGSIGTASNRLTIGTADTGLIFSSLDYIRPWNTDTNSSKDAALVLGGPSDRFKDLYLSGGVYLGGTGAANLLDSYEEGTWTATISDAQTGGNTGSTHTGRYRKVGTLVTVFCVLTNIDTTGLTATNVMYVQGLPFTSNANNNTQGTAKVDQVTIEAGRTYIYSQIAGNDTWLNFQTAGDSIGESNVDAQHITSGVSDIQFTIQYIT